MKQSYFYMESAKDLARYMTSDESIEKVIAKYPMKISSYYASLINWEDAKDPLRIKMVPSVEELEHGVTESDDTYGEQENTILPGFEHKYDSTAVILAADSCAGYCRDCFRRTFVSKHDHKRGVLTDYQGALDYIVSHKEIRDVLITGGDPLMLSIEKLSGLLSYVTKAPNVKKIRIGTRIPAMLPQRIDDRMVSMLAWYNIELRVMVNFSHPREITHESRKAIRKLKRVGRVYNQTPLLRGVNDDPEVLRKLFVELDNASVIPYYLFEKLPQRGTSHLAVSTREAFSIFDKARYGLEGTAQQAKYVIPTRIGKLEVLDVYERDGKTFARKKYLKTSRGFKGKISFEEETT